MMRNRSELWAFACIWAANKGGDVTIGMVCLVQRGYIMMNFNTKIDSDFNSDTTSGSARPDLARNDTIWGTKVV
jgi:hypothetical protein